MATLILVGAGCGTTSTAPATGGGADASIAATDTAATDTVDSMVEDTGDSAPEPSAADQSATDLEPIPTAEREGEWSTYTNHGLGFTFDWPRTGKYAPRWAVEFLDADEVADGCYDAASADRTIRVTADGQEFCHTWSDGDGEAVSAVDYYVTAIDERPVLIRFTKVSSGIYEFSWEEYRAFLDQIISSFQK